MQETKYPVSKETCGSCAACSLVTKTICFAPLPPEEWYYQCLAMMECECGCEKDGDV